MSKVRWSAKIKPHTKEWYDYRYEAGYGASEIATVLAQFSVELNALIWTPPVKLHLSKIGENVGENFDNVNAAAGRMMEKIIINWYKYWDNNEPDPMVMHENMEKGNRLNKIICRQEIVTHSDYPWLFASPDSIGYSDGKKEAYIESKNTTSMEAGRYEDRVSPSFICQVQQGLLLSELPYAKVLIFVDGFKPDVLTIFPDKDIQEAIIKYSKIAWLNVLKARQLKLEHNIEGYYGVEVDLKLESVIGELQALEPELTGTVKELEFVKAMVVPKDEDIKEPGTQDQWELLIARGKAKDQIKSVSSATRLIDEKLILSLKGSNYRYFDDEEKKYFSFKTDKKGVKRLYISPTIYK